MNLSELNALHILHVFFALVMVGTVFYACVGTEGARKRVLMWSGIASLLVVLTGVRMWQGLYGFAGLWPIVKLVCWLGLSACAGLAYRRRGQASLWLMLALVLALTSLTMVYLKPF